MNEIPLMIKSKQPPKKSNKKENSEHKTAFIEAVSKILSMSDGPLSFDEIMNEFKSRDINLNKYPIKNLKTWIKHSCINPKILNKENVKLVAIKGEVIKFKIIENDYVPENEEEEMLLKQYMDEAYDNYSKNGGNNKVFEEVIDKIVLEQNYSEEMKPFIDEIKLKISKLPINQKRFGILYVLDKRKKLYSSKDDIEFLVDLKLFINKRLPKTRHISDFMDILSDHIKYSADERTKFGEVMTPLELIDSMLDDLPKSVWSNPNLKWLDPCNGVGPFLVKVVFRLMEGLKDLPQFKDNEEKLYRHIIENMIYACELQATNMFIWLMMMNPHCDYNMNIYTGSFLDEGFKHHMEKIWKNKGFIKFDIIIGNPPYQDANERGEAKGGSGKLYPLFIKDSLNMLADNGYLLFVNPNTWFSGSEDSMTGKIFSVIKKYNLSKLHTEFGGESLQKRFFSGVGTGELTWILLEKNEDYVGTLLNGEDYIIDINEYEFLPNILNKTTLSLLSKTLLSKNEKINFVKDSGEYHDKETTRNDNKKISTVPIEGYFKIVNTITKKDGIKFLYMPYANYFQNNIKILISQSSSFDNLIIDNGEYGFTQNVTAIICKSISEAEDIKKLLNCDLYNYLITLTKYGPAISPRMLKTLPKVKYSSDKNLYDFFGLSDDEIKLLEPKKVKKEKIKK